MPTHLPEDFAWSLSLSDLSGLGFKLGGLAAPDSRFSWVHLYPGTSEIGDSRGRVSSLHR